MEEKHYHISILADATPKEAFERINSVAKWWTENLEGRSQKPGDEFTVRFGDVHVSTQKVVEVVPGKEVVWLVTDSTLNFIEDKHEWTNTRISFQIFPEGNKAKILFTHTGLVPEIECYSACSNAWSEYIRGSLLSLINTGRGNPALRDTGEVTHQVSDTPH